MMVSIDKAGRIVIPKAIRDQLDLRPDTALQLTVEGATIRIDRSSSAERHLAFTDDGRPYFPPGDDTSITDLDVQELRDAQAR